MQEIKRVLTGFISSLMIISFILMPIPQTNRAWAADSSNEDCVENPDAADNGLYKAGCKLDDAHTQAKMDTIYGSDNDKWTGYFQQAVFGMMSVVFLDNLFLKYLYAKDPKTYGNDCPENTAAKLTIRGAQLAALAYIIGEVQANIKYKEEAKAATDLNFAAKDKTYIPSEDSEEVKEYKEKLARGEDAGVDPRLQALKDNNAQEDAYDALIKVLEAQAEAIKTKIRLTTTAEIALLAVEAGELMSIMKCKGVCKESVQAIEDAYSNTTQMCDSASSDLSNLEKEYNLVSKTNVTYPQACKDLKQLLDEDKNRLVQFDNNSEANGKTNANNVDQEHEKKSGRFMGMFAGLAGIFKNKKIEDSEAAKSEIYTDQQSEDEKNENQEANENNQVTQEEGKDTAQRFSDVSQKIIECEKTLDDQNKETIKTEVDNKQIDIDNKQTEIDNKEMDIQKKEEKIQQTDSNQKTQQGLCNPSNESACKQAKELSIELGVLKGEKAALEIEKKELEAEKKQLETEKELLDQDKTTIDNAATNWGNIKKDLGNLYNQQFAYLFSRTQCCGHPGINTNEARDVQQIAKNLQSNWDAADLKNADGDLAKVQQIEQDMATIISTYSPGKHVDANAEGGSFVHQGLSEDSVMSKRKDITPFNPLKKKSSGIFNRNKDGFNIEFVLPILIENELYAFANKHYIDWNSHNPFLIQDQFKEVKQGIDGAIIKLKKHIHTTLNPAGPVQISFEDKIQTLQNGIRTILSKVTFISKAHAIDVSGAGMAIGGMALNMLASELGGPWAEVLNVGSKYLMLKGILNMLGMTELFLKPKSRSLTWAALLVLAAAIIVFDTKALEKVENHIAVVKAEKNRYLNSAAARTGLNADNKVNGNQSVKLEKYDPRASQTANMNVKACVVAKGNALAPGMCPSVIPKQRVSLPELSKRLSGRISADHLKNISMTTDALYGASNGSDMGAASLSDSKMDEINKTKNALKRLTASLRKEMEEDDKASAKRRGVKVNLGGGAGSFKKVFGSSVGGPSGGALSSGTLGASYNPKTGNSAFSSSAYKKNLKKKTGSSSSTAKGTTGGSDLDLDFGDDDMSSANGGVVSSSASKKKHSQDLRDYEVGMNDINQRKEVPIWKIISNRYILSYPKILEEDKK